MLTKRINIRKFLSVAMDLTPHTVEPTFFFLELKNFTLEGYKSFDDTFQIVSQFDKTSEYANAN